MFKADLTAKVMWGGGQYADEGKGMRLSVTMQRKTWQQKSVR